MHQIRFRLGFRFRPGWESQQHSGLHSRRPLIIGIQRFYVF